VTKEWALTFGFSLLTLLALGLGLTWVNIERVDMAYELKRLQTEIDAQEALISKLEVERNTLLTPERLRVLATQYGLTQARPGQIRRLSLAGEELPSPVLKAVPLPEKTKKSTEPKDAAKGEPKKGKKKKDGGKVAGESAAQAKRTS
jgi:cell division protein FtsL